MACAGLWEGWQQPDGAWLRSYSIITCAAAGRQALLHDRMPVILPPGAWAEWLEGEDAGALTALLRPAEDALLAFWPVSARVGRVAENDAALAARDPTVAAAPGLDDSPPPFG